MTPKISCHNHTKSFEWTHGSAEWIRGMNIVIISDSTSDDGEDTNIDEEGVEVVKEAENVSKGSKNNDELIAQTYICIFIV